MTRMHPIPMIATAFVLFAAPATADQVVDSLDAARSAYEGGNIGAALNELSIAQALMQQQKATGFQSFLPEAPDGWTREIDTEMSAGLAMFGGGTGTEATYTNGRDRVSLTLLADSPMIVGMGAMLNNPAMLMASGGTLLKVGDQRFAHTDSEYTGLIANRILVQASGDNEAAVVALLEKIDYAGLGSFAP